MTYNDRKSLVHVLETQAARQGDRVAYTFLADGERERDMLTYGALDVRARAIAAALAARGIRAGDRALLLYPPGLDFVTAFFGCLCAGVIAVPAYPPQPSQLERTLPRLVAVTSDADVSIVLSTAELAAMAPVLVSVAPAFRALSWLATDTVDESEGAHWRGPDVSRDTLAFLQYTSGSTAMPKGVMVSHGNLLHNLTSLALLSEHDSASVAVSWLPVIHDMGLIEGVLQPLFAGYPAYLMSPASFLQRPMRWLQAISRYRATNSGGPNFSYDLCVRKATAAQVDALDLSSWRCAYNGAEPIRARTLASFHETFARAGFRWRSFFPVYGLAESTLLVTSGTREDEPAFVEVASDEETVPASTLVSCGRTWHGATVRIVDPEARTVCRDGDIGEIWVSSPSVAQGYWRQPEMTASTFHAELHGDDRRWLRTGDLGIMRGEQLFIAGRLKDLIIVRGAKHFPQDLELTVEQQHPAIRPGCCAVFAIERLDDGAIGIAAEVDPRRASDEVALAAVSLAIRQGITERHGIQPHAVVLLRPGSLPKTTSGKLQRRACRTAFAECRLDELHRWVNTPRAPARVLASARVREMQGTP